MTPMMRTVWGALAPAVLAALATAGCVGTDAGGIAPAEGYHVSPTGSDANPGTAAAPWASIQHAVDTAGPGDTVTIHAGRYDEAVVISRSGRQGAPILLQAAPGEEVQVTSFEFAPGTSQIGLAGFTIVGYAVWGVTLAGDNHFIALTDLDVSGGESGIRLTVGYSGDPPQHGPVSDVTIEDCRVHEVQFTAVDGTPGPCDRIIIRRLQAFGAGLVGPDSFGADGIAIERGRDLRVEDCLVHDNGGDGIDLNSRDAGRDVGTVLVRGNQVYRNHRNGIKLWKGGTMERNAVWGQGLTPVVIGEYDCTVELSANTVAWNMWSDQFGARDYAMTVGYPADGQQGASVLLTLTDNIFAFNTGPAVGTPTGIYLGPRVQLQQEAGNVFFSRTDAEIVADFLNGPDPSIPRDAIQDGTWAALSGQGEDDLCVDPRFLAGWPNVDLHLQPGSPATGRGAY